MEPAWLEAYNTFAWVFSNVLIGYIGVTLILFAVGYQVLFDPKATTAGRFIFRFVTSLILVLALVFVGIFINPTSEIPWYEYPGDVYWWRPTVRLIAYGYVSYTVTALVTVLALRKFKPEMLKTAPVEPLVKFRGNV